MTTASKSMTPLTIYNVPCALGDQIMAIPAIIAHRERHGGKAVLQVSPSVKELVPKYDWLLDDSEASRFSNVKVTTIWAYVCAPDMQIHPTALFFMQLGLEIPVTLEWDEIVADEHAEQCDWILAPYSADPRRAMPNELFCEILRSIPEGDSVKIVGDPKTMRTVMAIVNGKLLLSLVGESLRTVAGMMKKARKGVVTVDSMPNRLACALGVTNHTLFAADTVTREWVEYPKLHRLVYGPPASWKIDGIFA